jgi:hypothetical protein
MAMATVALAVAMRPITDESFNGLAWKKYARLSLTPPLTPIYLRVTIKGVISDCRTSPLLSIEEKRGSMRRSVSATVLGMLGVGLASTFMLPATAWAVPNAHPLAAV